MRPGGLAGICCGLALAAIAPRLAFAGAQESVVLCAAPPPQSLELADTAPCIASGQLQTNAPAGVAITAAASDRGVFWTSDGSESARLTLAAEDEIDRAISFRVADLATPLGLLELRGGVGRIETSDALTFDRLRWANRLWEDATAVGIGATQRLAGGRLSVSSDLSWSSANAYWHDGAQGALEPWSQSGFAAAHKLDAKLVDEADFKWTLSVQRATRSDGYQGNAVARPPGIFGPAGETQRWATKLEAFGASFRAAHDSYAGRFGARETGRVEFATGGVTLAAHNKAVRRSSPVGPSAWASTKESQGIELEIEPASLGAGQSPLVPALVTLNWETGERAYAGGSPAEEIEAISALAQWTTAWGDTTATYSAERQQQGAASSEEDIFMDLSHSVKFGAWRLSAGADLSLLAGASDADSFGYDGASYHFAVRYAPAQGPQFESRLGRSTTTFELDDDFEDRTDRLTLTASLDLSDPLRRHLSREDLSLKLEYRHDLTQRETAEAEDPQRNTSALLMTFAIQKLGAQ